MSLQLYCYTGSILFSLTPILSGVSHYPHVQPIVITTFAAPPLSKLIPFMFVSLLSSSLCCVADNLCLTILAPYYFLSKSPFFPQLLSTFPAQ